MQFSSIRKLVGVLSPQTIKQLNNLKEIPHLEVKLSPKRLREDNMRLTKCKLTLRIYHVQYLLNIIQVSIFTFTTLAAKAMESKHPKFMKTIEEISSPSQSYG